MKKAKLTLIMIPLLALFMGATIFAAGGKAHNATRNQEKVIDNSNHFLPLQKIPDFCKNTQESSDLPARNDATHVSYRQLLALNQPPTAGYRSAKAFAKNLQGWNQLPKILQRIKPPTFPKRDFLVTQYGAVGDGVSDCHEAFKKAIAACTRAGGGRVVVPEGTFFIKGPIHLDNNINLHITKDATILFSPNFDDYLPRVRVRWEGTECYNYSPLIYAYKKKNIAITGKGRINAQADSTWTKWPAKMKPGTLTNEELRQMNHNDVPSEEIKINGKPTFFEPFGCSNVLIEGITIEDYPFWCVHPVFCKNVIIRKLRIISHNSNNDGIDPDSCEDVLIEDCYLDQSDDALAIKAGRDNSAWRAGKACRNIIVRNMPSNFEGVAIGSEISGGVENVYIYDSKYESGNVLYCKSNLDRGGFIRNVYIKNLDIGKGRIIRMRNNYHGYRGGHFPTEMSNIHIENVHIKQGTDETISITGNEEAHVKNVFIKNVTVDEAAPPILAIRLADNVVLENVRINGKLQPEHPPMLPPEAKEPEGTPSIAPRKSGLYSSASNWETGRDGARLNWAGDSANRLPNDKIDKRILVGKGKNRLSGVTLTLDQDLIGQFEVRVYEQSTLIMPAPYNIKIKGPLIVDRTNSVAFQIGANVEISKNLDIDAAVGGEYVISGGSLKVGTLSLNEGTLTIDDAQNDIDSIIVRGEFRTHKGDGNTITRFIANHDGVTPIQCRDISLEAYLGEKLIVDVSAYDYAKNGDLVLFKYTGTRKGIFDGGPENPKAQVTIIDAKADLVYDDAEKQIKLTNFRP